MRSKVLVSFVSLFTGCLLSAQNYYMQYSHDTLGNRTSGVRVVLTRETESEELNADTLLANYHTEDSLVAILANESEETWSYCYYL